MLPDNLGTTLKNLGNRLSSEVCNFHIAISTNGLLYDLTLFSKDKCEKPRFMSGLMSLDAAASAAAALILKLR